MTKQFGSTPAFLRITARAALGAGLMFVAPVASADQIGPYSGRSLTLGQGTFRIDAGPPDYGYFHPASPQWINENRGFRLRHSANDPRWAALGLPHDIAAEDQAWLGIGLAYGITSDVELGGLVLPLRLEPDLAIDDLEFYGRFRFLRRKFEMGAQVTLQVPTETEFGLGLGMPMLAHVGRRMRIDTGFEFELLFWEPDLVVSLDVPLAFTWDVGRVGFLGFRSGVYAWDMDVVLIPAGIHGGVAAARGRLDLGGWFMWPGFIGVEREEPIEVETFEIGVGLNGRI